MIPDWQKQLADGVDANIPRGVYDLDEPLVMPEGADCIVTGNRAILRTHDEDMDAFVCSGAAKIRDLRFLPETQRGGAAFRCTPDYQISGLELTNVEVLAGGLDRAFRFGVVLNNCWNSTLTVNVQGLPTDYTEEALLNPRMAIALDLGNSQCPVCDVMISGAGIGIHSKSEQQGDAEGVIIRGRWIQHCRRCIHLEGRVYGGTPTPHASIEGSIHLFYTGEGIFALHRHSLSIDRANCCGSHLNPDGTVAMWLVDCPNLSVTSNTVWRTFPGPHFPNAGLGIVVDATDGAIIRDNQVTKDVDLGFYVSSSCRNIDSRMNREAT